MPQQIKLFGHTISLPPLHHFRDFSSANPSCLDATALVSHNFSDEATASSHDYDYATHQPSHDADMESAGTKTGDDKHEETGDTKDEATAPPSSSGLNEMPTASSSDRPTSASDRSSNNGPQENLTSDNSQDRTLKKPDKIFPCPRCNSTDTKFCYYNNYNVNQPRHFCKNCQRYWTAGGTMRNVPFGAGRRKNKSSSVTHCRNIIVSEALRNSLAHNSSFGRSTTVLNFGADSPFCDSVASALNPSDLKNGYHRPEQTTAVSGGRRANDGDDRLSGNSVTDSSIAAQIPCYKGPTWPYQWAPTFCPSGFSVSFYHAPPYWGCAVPHPWSSVSPCSSPKSISPSSNHCADGLSPTSPLGKHSRKGDVLSPCSSKKPSRESNCSDTNSVSVPKTLRIDDPTEAAKSSIWVTLGISSDKSSTNGGSLFKGYESKNEDRSFSTEKQYSSVLQANPAALSRALNFRESN